jgi:hypothetical protein
MASAVAGPEIERLIQLLARLPGLGPRSARRAALHLIKKREALMTPLSDALQVAIDKIQVCRTCGNIDTQDPCTVCTDMRRDPAARRPVRRGLQGEHCQLEAFGTVPGKASRHRTHGGSGPGGCPILRYDKRSRYRFAPAWYALALHITDRRCARRRAHPRAHRVRHSRALAVFLLVKNDRAAKWYSSYGAIPLADAPLSLILPLVTIQSALDSSGEN